MKILNKILSILKIIFPSTKTELWIFLFFVILYGTNAWFIAENFRIIYDDRIPWDGYFSFDNRAIVQTGGGFERHPLSNYFFDCIRDFALWISGNHYNSVFRLVLAMFSTVVISLANVQIFKYLNNIIQLPLKISLLILVFYGLFVTNILLSFTPETYTYTLLFLSIFNYYSARKIQEEKPISFGATIFSSVFIGGLTITNIVKVYIPFLFEKKIFWNWKKIGMAAAKIATSVVVFVFLFMLRLNFNFQNFLNKTEEQYDKFSKPKATPLWDMIYSWFFGGNILFSNYEIRDYHNKDKTFYYKALFMDVYSSVVPYVFVGLIVLIMIWSIFRNYKNKLIWILVITFLFDVLVHCILKFGLHTSYIYGGHFVFVYPLLIGWLFFSYRDKTVALSLFYGLLLIMTVYLGMNNYYRLTEFYQFLETYYR
ncbi:DUF6080 domain-containing protein [Epilithonimonas arachidiradicis]|uniref:Uncharacterized protein n=1 Tax=Epilithonimonas arachidiradicis TaxID=1617282 RepID=A0A420DCF6_9FLAO|nr:DUF6080 domain-containing protein [Epilithonimonas arachidiradicis]RKE89588.1 hypothetical protein BXY58_0158 [Epilithonimonas arachidiradicis]GGG43738.1 hypothetical protein GCM10007332_01470 [Epilithonimonas arachidiradicis]